MRHRSRYSYMLSMLAVAATSTAAAADGPQVPPPHTWQVDVKQPQSATSWQAPLAKDNADAFKDSPPAPKALLGTSDKHDLALAPQAGQGECKSSGSPVGKSAIACAALVGLSAAVQSVRKQD